MFLIEPSLLLRLALEVILDLVLVLLRDELQVLRVVVGGEGGEGAPVVPHADVLVVVVQVPLDVRQLSSHGVQHGLGGARVPLLAAGTGEHVRVGLALDQEHDLNDVHDVEDQ